MALATENLFFYEFFFFNSATTLLNELTFVLEIKGSARLNTRLSGLRLGQSQYKKTAFERLSKDMQEAPVIYGLETF